MHSLLVVGILPLIPARVQDGLVDFVIARFGIFIDWNEPFHFVRKLPPRVGHNWCHGQRLDAECISFAFELYTLNGNLFSDWLLYLTNGSYDLRCSLLIGISEGVAGVLMSLSISGIMLGKFLRLAILASCWDLRFRLVIPGIMLVKNDGEMELERLSKSVGVIRWCLHATQMSYL